MADSYVSVAGTLRDGLRVAAQFTALDWVQAQLLTTLGLAIVPGTVNLQVEAPEGLALLARLRAGGGVPLAPPDATYCMGRAFPARIGPLAAAVIVPDVPDYPPDKLELVAGVRVRDALALQPGDRVEVEVDLTPRPPLPRGEGEHTASADHHATPRPLRGEGTGERV